MPKKLVPYSKTKSVKAVARERIGTPPPSRPLLDKTRRERPKYKKLIHPEE